MSDRRARGSPAEDFVATMIEHGVLAFGHFVLKSGRESPYFFNLGRIDTGEGLDALGRAYARVIIEQGYRPDVLFGPAYKGIPIAAATAVALARDHDVNVGIAFDRKEVKDHGEGGVLIGHSLAGRVVIVDDLVTDGTAKRAAARLVRDVGGVLEAIVVALDRQERVETGPPRTAVQRMADELGVPITCIATLEDVIRYLDIHPKHAEALGRIRAYQAQHCLLSE